MAMRRVALSLEYSELVRIVLSRLVRVAVLVGGWDRMVMGISRTTVNELESIGHTYLVVEEGVELLTQITVREL